MVDSLSGILSSVTDQPLILDAPATGGPPTCNTMDPHLQSVNPESRLACPQTLMCAPQQTNPKVYPRQRQSSSRSQIIQKRRDTGSKLFSCIIPGCNRIYTRIDSHGKHLRDGHGIPIPKGKRANKWLFKPENYHHIKAAIDHQKRMNDMYSCAAKEEEYMEQGGQT